MAVNFSYQVINGLYPLNYEVQNFHITDEGLFQGTLLNKTNVGGLPRELAVDWSNFDSTIPKFGKVAKEALMDATAQSLNEFLVTMKDPSAAYNTIVAQAPGNLKDFITENHGEIEQKLRALNPELDLTLGEASVATAVPAAPATPETADTETSSVAAEETPAEASAEAAGAEKPAQFIAVYSTIPEKGNDHNAKIHIDSDRLRFDISYHSMWSGMFSDQSERGFKGSGNYPYPFYSEAGERLSLAQIQTAQEIILENAPQVIEQMASIYEVRFQRTDRADDVIAKSDIRNVLSSIPEVDPANPQPTDALNAMQFVAFMRAVENTDDSTKERAVYSYASPSTSTQTYTPADHIKAEDKAAYLNDPALQSRLAASIQYLKDNNIDMPDAETSVEGLLTSGKDAEDVEDVPEGAAPEEAETPDSTETATPEASKAPMTPAAPSAPARLTYDAKIAELQQAFVDADPKYTNILRYSGSNGVDGLRGRRTNEAIDLYARENNLDASDLDAMIEHAKAHPYKAPEPAPEEKSETAPEEENAHTTEVSAPEAADEDLAQPETPADTTLEKAPAMRAHWIAAAGKPVMFDIEAENSYYQANGQTIKLEKGQTALVPGFNVSAGVEDTHVRPEDNRWAKALDGYDPKTKLMSPDATAEQRSAAATGVIDIGRHGEIYVTRVDAHFGLDRYQVNDLIAAEGVDQLNVNTVPLMPGSEMGARFNNIMNDLGRFGQFDKAAGFVVTLESGLQARVFDGGQGMQLEIFKDGQRSPEIDRAQEQTPPFDRFGKYWYNDMNKAGETFDKIGRVGWSMPAAAATIAVAEATTEAPKTTATVETPETSETKETPKAENGADATGTGGKSNEPDVDFNALRAIDNSMNRI